MRIRSQPVSPGHAPTAAPAAVPVALESLYRLRPKAIWACLKRQPASFWLLCIYMFFEYVRPQGMYRIWLPFTSVAMVLCAIAFVLEGARVRRITLADPLLVLYTAVIVVSSVSAYYPSWAYNDLVPYYFAWILAIFLISNIVNTEERFLVFMVVYFLYCVKMSQFGLRLWVLRGGAFTDWGVSCGPQFFQNSGECGIQMAMFFPASLYFFLALKIYLDRRTKWVVAFLPVSAAVTILSTSSRGAQLALAGILLWIVLRSRQQIKALVLSAATAGALYAFLPAEQMERFRTMGTDETSMTRRQYWSHGIEILNNHPMFGIGFRNWLPYYRGNYDPRGELPHNIFVEAAAELGYAGLVAFVLLIIATLLLNYRTRKMAAQMGGRGRFLWYMGHGFDGALIGFLLGGFFVTVLYYPFFWIHLAMTLALYNTTRDEHEKFTRGLTRSRGGVKRGHSIAMGRVAVQGVHGP